MAIAYKNQNNYSSGEYNTKVEAWLTFMFIRQFSSSYVGASWDGTGKAIDTGFVNYVKAEDIKLYAYFESKTDYYATATGRNDKVYVTDGSHCCINAKSFLGLVAAREFDELWCESEKDIYNAIERFIVK